MIVALVAALALQQSHPLRSQLAPPPAALFENKEGPFVITNPSWVRQPTARRPTSSPPLRSPGVVAFTCIVTVEGRARLCQIDEESPRRAGLGKAVLDAAPTFRINPRTVDGVLSSH